MLLTWLIIVVAIFSMICFLYFKQKDSRPKNLKGKHVLISGGSSGIGFCLAKEALSNRANVTIFARNLEKLKAAEDELKSLNNKIPPEERGRIQSFSCDVGGPKKKLTELLELCESSFGSVNMLINCAGFANAEKFEDVSEESVKELMAVNFFGSFFMTQEVVRSMKRNDKGGSIVFISSAAGLFGLFGFSGYAASKGAVIRLAETLHMELKPLNITVTVGLPPDTDTPGLVRENLNKPVETHRISESGGLFQPEVVAQTIFEDALEGKFYSTNGVEGYILKILCTGMSPVVSFCTFIQEVFLAGLFRSVAYFYLRSFASIVKNEHEKRLSSKKLE